MTPAELAKRMFNAYNGCQPNPWKTFDGRDVPTWDQLTDQVRGKWEAAALEATLALVEEREAAEKRSPGPGRGGDHREQARLGGEIAAAVIEASKKK